ncbi:MAG: transcriptional repressor LexA [Minisyncoccia bacterium]
MNKELTQKQSKVLSAIKEFINNKGFSPTFEELRKLLAKRGMKLKSNNSLVQYINALEEKGFVQNFKKLRGIRLLSESVKNFIAVPLLGNANCGEALSFADDHIEDFINISKEYIQGNQNDYFFIKAVGDSMNKSKINNGDLVLVKKPEREPQLNNIVVAVINGLGTIKKFQKIDDVPVLLPDSTNISHQPIILHPDDQINICGNVEKVFNFSAMEK